ncbi:SNF2 family N-terminal domain-containing protein [Fimicolochytrium jonesii]|uniref:SNF2 family N-terminal domain-containing protein n=1 Tax=Fimicolochytrium jonesii TaxID=1396493 RepID=UPI0022FE6600|nr:SNF2 family N-terminal domain-containing protein [Fimicolochytrium jonesii]KAI8816220.1 SNF2 family N-terminal domain-containing protein [Fimicolochytrium jonesii]
MDVDADNGSVSVIDNDSVSAMDIDDDQLPGSVSMSTAASDDGQQDDDENGTKKKPEPIKVVRLAPAELARRKAGFAKDSEELRRRKARDQQKRYAYLMGQTEIFSHFINISKMKGADVTALEEATDAEKAKTNSKDGSRRHRKTEKEEDEELLHDEMEEEETATYTFDDSPSYVKHAPMRDYQVQGLNWLISLFENGINGILADEMGLGKTLQSISFLGYLKHYQSIDGPHLVIVPKSTLHNWVKEFERWCPSLNVFMFHGSKPDRQHLVQDKLLAQDFEVCVTSYEMCLLEKAAFRKLAWQYIVIDEAHRIKNENSALSQIVREFQCRNRLLLTGTPLQNNLHELWALLNFLLPDIFSSSEDFDKWFEAQGGDQNKVVTQLHKVLRPFLLRRIKADVEKSLLPKKRLNIYVGMSVMQRKWYQRLLEKDIDAVNNALGEKSTKARATRLQNIVMQLRKCCNHPYLFDGAEPGPPYTTDEHIVENAGKMVVLDRLLTRSKASGSRVLLFSQMSRMLDILEDYCIFRGYEYCRIDGNTPHEDRVASIDEYNKPDSSKFIFLLTTRAGGLGINLATADHVVMYDSDWNPQVDLQAEDRAHRIGQKKQVYIFRFITENAVEEKVIDRATQKLRLDQLVIQQGRAAPQTKSASKDELLSMIQHGAQDIFKSTDSTIKTGEDIEDLLRRSEQKTAELDSKYANMGLDDLQKFSVAGGGSVYEWEGSDFRNNNNKPGGGGGFGWIGPAKRERKSVLQSYSEQEYYKGMLQTGGRTSKEKAPKPPKIANIQDFQFYPTRLRDLQEREILAFRREINYKVRPDDIDDGPTTSEDADDAASNIDLVVRVAEEQARIDAATPLTPTEIAEKDRLLSKGFSDWSKRDFVSFCKACEKHGRHDLASISAEIEGKTPAEVKAYSEVFWKRVKELADWEKVVANIEKGEARLRKVQEVQDILTTKVRGVRLPLQQLRIVYLQSKGKNYTEEEDRFLLVMLERYGYGSDEVYDKILSSIKTSPLFRFDWFIKSRTAVEIQRRCTTLISLVTKEVAAGAAGAGGGVAAGGEEEEEREERKRKSTGGRDSPRAVKKRK